MHKINDQNLTDRLFQPKARLIASLYFGCAALTTSFALNILPLGFKYFFLKSTVFLWDITAGAAVIGALLGFFLGYRILTTAHRTFLYAASIGFLCAVLSWLLLTLSISFYFFYLTLEYQPNYEHITSHDFLNTTLLIAYFSAFLRGNIFFVMLAGTGSGLLLNWLKIRIYYQKQH